MSETYCPACRTHHRSGASHNCTELAAREEALRRMDNCSHARARKLKGKDVWPCPDCGFDFVQDPRRNTQST